MPIHESAVLVQLSVSQFYNELIDPNATKKVTDAEGVDTTAFRAKFVRTILPKHALSTIKSAIRELRSYHRSATMPWSDGNYRLLPGTKYFEHGSRVNEFVTKIDRAVGEVVDNYEAYKNQARLGAGRLWRDEDVPPASYLREAFRVRLSYMQIANLDDFRLKNVEKDIDKVRDKMRADMADQVRGTAQHHLVALYGALCVAKERLSDPEAKLFSSLFDRLRTTAELGKSMEEVAPDLGTFSSDTLVALESRSMDDLRNDDGIRAETARVLGSIAEQLRVAHGYGKITSDKAAGTEQAAA